MTTPEYEPKANLPKEVKETVERFDSEAEKQLQEIGAQVQPQPQQIQDQQGQVIAQPVPAPHDPSQVPTVQIPVDQATAATMSSGSVSDSNTWLGVWVIRKIKVALSKGWQIIIGRK